MIVAIVAAAIFLLLLVFVVSAVKIVQPYQRGVVERLGRVQGRRSTPACG